MIPAWDNFTNDQLYLSCLLYCKPPTALDYRGVDINIRRAWVIFFSFLFLQTNVGIWKFKVG